MCFVVKSINKPIPKIAETDIICYKEVDTDLKPLVYSDYPAYVVGEIYKALNFNDDAIPHLYVQEGFKFDPDIWLVAVGIHTYAKRAEATMFTTILKCIIPKGTEYLYDGEFEYVSTQVKVIDLE